MWVCRYIEVCVLVVWFAILCLNFSIVVCFFRRVLRCAETVTPGGSTVYKASSWGGGEQTECQKKKSIFLYFIWKENLGSVFEENESVLLLTGHVQVGQPTREAAWVRGGEAGAPASTRSRGRHDRGGLLGSLLRLGRALQQLLDVLLLRHDGGPGGAVDDHAEHLHLRGHGALLARGGRTLVRHGAPAARLLHPLVQLALDAVAVRAVADERRDLLLQQVEHRCGGVVDGALHNEVTEAVPHHRLQVVEHLRDDALLHLVAHNNEHLLDHARRVLVRGKRRHLALQLRREHPAVVLLSLDRVLKHVVAVHVLEQEGGRVHDLKLELRLQLDVLGVVEAALDGHAAGLVLREVHEVVADHVEDRLHGLRRALRPPAEHGNDHLAAVDALRDGRTRVENGRDDERGVAVPACVDHLDEDVAAGVGLAQLVREAARRLEQHRRLLGVRLLQQRAHNLRAVLVRGDHAELRRELGDLGGDEGGGALGLLDGDDGGAAALVGGGVRAQVSRVQVHAAGGAHHALCRRLAHGRRRHGDGHRRGRQHVRRARRHGRRAEVVHDGVELHLARERLGQRQVALLQVRVAHRRHGLHLRRHAHDVRHHLRRRRHRHRHVVRHLRRHHVRRRAVRGRHLRRHAHVHRHLVRVHLRVHLRSVRHVRVLRLVRRRVRDVRHGRRLKRRGRLVRRAARLHDQEHVVAEADVDGLHAVVVDEHVRHVHELEGVGRHAEGSGGLLVQLTDREAGKVTRDQVRLHSVVVHHVDRVGHSPGLRHSHCGFRSYW
eukprot:Rhum_TRINITY_DN9127_c0_g10::Rhum_TRINITY_DN9127_c0_g10_i1::g.32127::m.32127